MCPTASQHNDADLHFTFHLIQNFTYACQKGTSPSSEGTTNGSIKMFLPEIPYPNS